MHVWLSIYNYKYLHIIEPLVIRSLFGAQPLESAVPLLLQYSQYFDYIDF